MKPRQAGFTLIEVTIVVVLSGLVTLGLVAFYINSQALWLDSSTQALAQRDATTLIEAMREQAETAASAAILPAGGGGTNHVLVCYDNDLVETGRFFWSPADSTVHFATGSTSGDDKGPVVPTKVERFFLTLDPNLPIVYLDTLRVHSTTGQQVQMASSLTLFNAP